MRDTDGVQDHQEDVYEGRNERRKGLHNVHDAFDQEYEHGEDGDDDIPIRDAVAIIMVNPSLCNDGYGHFV